MKGEWKFKKKNIGKKKGKIQDKKQEKPTGKREIPKNSLKIRYWICQRSLHNGLKYSLP